MRTPPTLTDDEIINVAAGVGGRYAAERPWLERDDTVQQAVLEGFIVYKTYDATKANARIEPWLGWMVRNRLHDWSRKQHVLYSHQRNRERSYRVLFVEYEEVLVKGREDMGYWYVEELDALAPMLTKQEKTGKMEIKDEEWFNTLTARQAEILQLFADGYITDDIATQLYISSETVKTTLKTVRFRLRAVNTTHAVANALRLELIN